MQTENTSNEFFCRECNEWTTRERGFRLIGCTGLVCTDCMRNQFGFEYDELDAKPCRHLVTAECKCAVLA